jgi:D-alanyl-lipoteichoic acid acyltransferase DltB (MBOAT superfamily)
MYVSYLSGAFDFTGTQMVLTMKLTSFAYNLYDGTVDRANLLREHSDKNVAKIYADRRKFAIDKLPNPLEFFGYVYCFTCLLAGPAFEYTDYSHSIDNTKFKRKDGKIEPTPSSLVPGLSKMIAAIFYLAAHIVSTGYIQLSRVYDPAFVASHGFLYRCVYLYLALFAVRFKYYFVWMAAEGASNLGGFGFQGFDAKGNPIGWEDVKNIDIVGFETAPCIQQLSRAWNKRTQGWLERYTYQRTNRSLIITYFVSALWHGLYPGFFLFFMSLPLLTNVERLIRAKITPRIVPGYDGHDYSSYPRTVLAQAYWIGCIFCNTLIVCYVVQVR